MLPGLAQIRWGRTGITTAGDNAGDGPGSVERSHALAHDEEDFDETFRAAQAGAAWAFERLYARLAPAVSGYLRMQRSAEPDDLTSEVFLGVFRGLGTFQGSEQQFRSWVFTIAHRRLQDERRRAARRPHLTSTTEAVPQQPGGDVEQDAMDALGDRWVVQVSGMLSADQRTVLLLRVVADLTAEDVAQITGKTVGAVRALQRRALEALRRQLTPERDRPGTGRVTGATNRGVQE